MSNSYKTGTSYNYKTKTTIIDNPTFHTPLQVNRITGVRTYRPYMTTLEALQDKEKKKRRKKIVIFTSLFAILLIIGAVSVALALTVFKTTSKIEDKNIPSAVPSSIPYNLLTTSYPDTHEIIVLGETRLDVHFPRLHGQREDLIRKFILAVDNLYKDSDVKQYYESTTVTQLRPGSVVVYFEMLIKEPLSKSVDSSSLNPKTIQVIEIFKQETLDGQLGEYILFPESVKLYIKSDTAQISTSIPVGSVTTPPVEKTDSTSTTKPVRPTRSKITTDSSRATRPQIGPVITTKGVETTAGPVTTSQLTTSKPTTIKPTTDQSTTKVTTISATTTTIPATTTPLTTTSPLATTTPLITTTPSTTNTPLKTTTPLTTTMPLTTTTQLTTTTPLIATTPLTTTESATTIQRTTISTTQRPTTERFTTELATTQTTTIPPTTEVTTRQETTTDLSTSSLLTTTKQVVPSTQPSQTTKANIVSQSLKHEVSTLPDVFGGGCESLECFNDGTCDDTSGFAMCECAEGYFGISCDQSACDYKFCENGGICRADGMYNTVCDCPLGYIGSSCEIALSIQPCVSNPCQNEGNCTAYNDIYFCSCPYPYGGYNCETNTIGEGGEQNTPSPLCTQVPLDICRQHVPYNTSGLEHPYQVVKSTEEAGEMIIHYRTVLQSCDDNIDRLVCLIFSPECPSESGFPRSACSDYCVDVLYTCMSSIDPYTSEINEAIMTLYQICMELPNAEELCIGPQNKTQTVDPCLSNPCLNGGLCISYGAQQYAYFMCECTDGYIGEICDVEFDLTSSICTATTCLNGGTCEESDYIPQCICPDGFIGQQCEEVVYSGQESIDEDDMYESICSGIMSSCVNVLPYNLTSPTNNMSQESITSVSDQYQRSVSTCDHPDVESFLCSVLNPECVPSNALFGAPRTACKSLCNEIRIACPDVLPMNASTFEQYCDYFIESSDINICIPLSKPANSSETDHVCSNVTCRNGGICFEFERNALCKCREGFSGSLCELEYADPCISSPCVNQGKCVTDVTNFYVSYECECLDGFYGTHCEQSLCDDLPCSNGGTCRPSGLTPECICPEGYAGSYCEINLYPADPCQSNPCLHDGTCQSQIIGLYTAYYCVCQTGFYGRDCEHDNPCIPNPCQNSGHCTHNETGSFTCSCAQGHGGLLCDIELDACVSSPCFNGGICVNDGGRYFCSCPLGYEGQNCQEDVNQQGQTT